MLEEIKMPLDVSILSKCVARVTLSSTGEEMRPVYRPLNHSMLEKLNACASINEQAAALITHLLVDGELVTIDPRILKRASPRRAREMVDGIFKSREAGVVFCGNIKGEKQMEISNLENIFKEKTPVTLATVTPEGEITEEVVNIYHHSPFDSTGESLKKKTTVLGLVLEVEKDKDNPVPVITRQLEILGIYSRDFTKGGEKVVIKPNVESIGVLPLPVQRTIAQKICAPALVELRAFAAGATNGGKDESNGEDKANAEQVSRDTAEAGSGDAETVYP